MKKVFILVLVVIMLFSMSGCITVVDGVPQEEYDALKEKYDELKDAYDTLLGGETEEGPNNDKPVGKFDEETVLSQLEVTEYSCSNDFWCYALLVIKNNSGFNLDISATAKFYNEAGELIGVKENEESPFASGSEIVLCFMPDEKYDKMEYEFTVEEEDWYESVVHELSYESTPAKNKEILSVTNNGDKAADFVEAYALFFNGDDFVYFSNDFFVDNDFELKPGKTISKELDCYEEYTSVRFILTGRR